MSGYEHEALPLCRSLLKARGYRLTTARETVVGVLAAAETGEHLSAEDISEKFTVTRLAWA